jgi:hypothetical protein
MPLDFSIYTISNNSLYNELSSLTPYVYINTNRADFNRSLFFIKTTFFKNFLLNTLSETYVNSSFENLLNLKYFFNALKYYTGGYISDIYDDHKHVNSLFKSQYRPMRKGITNMVRLQATNAIAMPTEIRLHILASSKDVIHS